ncbi:MAG: NAD-binding protein [Chloroflexota bacterium]
MDSFKETQRQIASALIGIAIIFTVAVVGFMLIEGLSLSDALWLTTMTLTTVGYGDIYAESEAGHFWTIFVVLSGFGLVAYGLQATATFLVSPEIRDLRDTRRTQRTIRRLEHHYIICGNGELVDQTITYLLQSVRMRIAFYDEEIYGPIDNFLDRIFGDDEDGHYPRIRAAMRRTYLWLNRPFKRVGTLLDLIVVITDDPTYARHLRNDGFLVIEGTPTSDETLQNANVQNATAMMVALADDTETLLTVLTARNLNGDLYITASAQAEELTEKIWRVGANNVIHPFELAGQFMNNLTLRPTVYDFFNGILFDHTLDIQTTQVTLQSGSKWIDKRIRDLELDKLDGAVIGIRTEKGEFIVAPNDTYIMCEGEVIIIVAPSRSIPRIKVDGREGVTKNEPVNWQRPPSCIKPRKANRRYTPEQAEKIVAEMEKHFIVCVDDDSGRNAVLQLDPERPFVIVSDDDEYVERVVERGFCVIHGDPTRDSTLLRAGADRALALMISLADEADTVLTVISARSISKRLLITATANMDENIHKIHSAGADRVISPYSIAAQFILLSTTRPTVSNFFKHVLFNYHEHIETTELYMQDDAAWIGRKIHDLRLERLYRASVIGVRQTSGKFVYAPQGHYEIKAHEVLIIVTPMANSDEIRMTAHGSATKRPDTLRSASVIQTTVRRNPLLD